MVASKTSLIGGLALAIGVCALVAKAPGAWGCAASWASLSIALYFWERARSSEASARSMSEMDQQAYAQGLPVLEADLLMKRAARLNFKTGALLSLGAMVAFMGSVICALGSFAVGLGWGILACVPLAWLAIHAIKNVSEEARSESVRPGRGGRNAR